MAAEKANWDESLPNNWGRGISIHQSFGTIVAQVVEIEIIAYTVKVQRVVCVADPGFAFHPDGFNAQMESGIVYGLTAALYGEITIENGAVKQRNFHDNQMLRMNASPIIETYAIFNATGIRIRELPVKNHNLNTKPTLLG